MTASAVQPGIIFPPRHDRNAGNSSKRESQAGDRADTRIVRGYPSPDSIHDAPVKINNARRIFAQNLDPRGTVRHKICAVRKLEQRQAVVVDCRHGCYPLDGANIFRNASQGSTVSNSLIAKRNQCFGLVVDYGISPRCSGNKSRHGSFRDSGCAA